MTLTGRRDAISSWFRKFTTEVDLLRSVYRETGQLLGLFKWEHKKKLPRIDYVLVFRQFFAKCEACDFDDTGDDDAYYQVSMVHHRRHRLVFHETNTRAEAFQKATELAAALNVHVLDSASCRGKSTWLHGKN